MFVTPPGHFWMRLFEKGVLLIELVTGTRLLVGLLVVDEVLTIHFLHQGATAATS